MSAPDHTDAFIAHLAEVVDDEVTAAVQLGGGDTARAYRVTLASGATIFAKTHPRPPSPHFFTTEATGLTWLRDASHLNVPEVLAVADQASPTEPPALLALEWIEEGRRTGNATDEAAFGMALARTHQTTPPSFGRPDHRTTGSLALPNQPCATWPEFYATQRLEPLARIAADRNALSPTTIASIDAVAARLDTYGAADEPPALLHGDLWAGNRIVDTTGTSWVIDPAVHGGHREYDLAMMRLFGGFGPGAFDAYDQTTPLADGWNERIALHQLAPLIVHAIKFGGSYAAATDRALAELL